LLGGGLFAELAGDRLTDPMSHLFDGPEIGIGRDPLRAKERLAHRAHEIVVAGILLDRGLPGAVHG